MIMLSKAQIMKTVDAIARRRLFTDEKWLSDCPTARALTATLETLGLLEQLPDGDRCTSLGKEINIDLQSVFMGLWNPWDAVHILQSENLLGEDEVDELLELVEIDGEHCEPLLRARVQEAYRDYYGSAALH
jgi:hypothetical protein